MPGTSQCTALLDANVLYPALIRDVLLSFAHADLYSAKWSLDIKREWTLALIENKPNKRELILAAADIMDEAIPDCMVIGYEHLIEGLQLPDKNDRHVLAAAITGRADVIVSLNTKDFPKALLSPFQIDIQTPDEFILNQLILRYTTAWVAIKSMRERWERPQYTAQATLELFERRGLIKTSAYLRQAVDLI